MGFVKKMKEKVGDYFNPNNEKAYNKFSESEKEEMLESLKMVDSTDLYGLDFSDLGESTVESSRGDTVNFREGVVKKDSIGNYIIVNGMKCREYQPGISGFVYQDIRSRYNPNEWLNVGFCEKGVFKKSITIDENFGPRTFDKMPSDINKKLGGPFYLINDTESIRKNPLFNISRESIYPSSNGDPKLSKSNDEYSPSENRRNKDGKISLNINGMWFKPFKEGISGFVYQEFSDLVGHDRHILLAEYKDGKMIGEGVVLNSNSKTYITKNNKK